MTIYLISRHEGALAWMRTQGLAGAVPVRHLDPAWLAPGDIVAGNLPLHLAAEASVRGARFLHLALDLPEVLRGHPLGGRDLAALGARLEEYRVLRLDP